MLQASEFTTILLDNRLGQAVELGVTYVPTAVRDYVFITALNQQASSFVGKNAEPFAFQLCDRFQLDPRRFELIELRSANIEYPLWRWRFEWVGHSPLAGRSEAIISKSQQNMLFDLLNPRTTAKVVGVA